MAKSRTSFRRAGQPDQRNSVPGQGPGWDLFPRTQSFWTVGEPPAVALIWVWSGWSEGASSGRAARFTPAARKLSTRAHRATTRPSLPLAQTFSGRQYQNNLPFVRRCPSLVAALRSSLPPAAPPQHGHASSSDLSSPACSSDCVCRPPGPTDKTSPASALVPGLQTVQSRQRDAVRAQPTSMSAVPPGLCATSLRGQPDGGQGATPGSLPRDEG